MRDRAELIANVQFLEILKIAEMAGLWAGTRKESGRLSEEQSRINCVNMEACGG